MQNSCVIWNEETKNAAVTDPGGDLDKIESYLETNGLKLKKIFITHGHLDHAGGAFNLSQKYKMNIFFWKSNYHDEISVILSKKKFSNFKVNDFYFFKKTVNLPTLLKKKINNDLKFQLSEITRERIFKFTNQEVPYSAKIKTSFETYENLVKVSQIILVKKNSQKAILIGKAGQKIKHIGTDTRPEMEKLLKKKVFLDLKVSFQPKKT